MNRPHNYADPDTLEDLHRGWPPRKPQWLRMREQAEWEFFCGQARREDAERERAAEEADAEHIEAEVDRLMRSLR